MSSFHASYSDVMSLQMKLDRLSEVTDKKIEALKATMGTGTSDAALRARVATLEAKVASLEARLASR